MTSIYRVAVIGAGAAGLCATRHLTADSFFSVKCFEQTFFIGGTWVYDDAASIEKHANSPTSSMYKNLITNLPKEIMAFLDFPFPQNSNSFLHHTHVRKYLENYSTHFGLNDYIYFGHKVIAIEPETSATDTKWKLTIESVKQTSTSLLVTEEEFDAVVVCNGHFSVPFIPKFKGVEKFKGLILHSYNYRTPECYKGHSVICIGASNSGKDIALDLSSHAQIIYLSHSKNRIVSSLPVNVSQTESVSEIAENGVILTDGQWLEVDVIIYCTGYKYDFAFLAKDVISPDRKRLSNLYKHLIHSHYHNLSFVGIPQHVVPFPLFDVQVNFVKHILRGLLKLPSEFEMLESIAQDYNRRVSELRFPHHYAHHMYNNLQWDYISDLCKEIHFKFPEHIEKLYKYCVPLRNNFLCSYRDHNFNITSDGEIEEI